MSNEPIRAICRACLYTALCSIYAPFDDSMTCEPCQREYEALLEKEYGAAVDAFLAEIGAGR